MRVAVYSGSFNPLHKGHLAIIRHLTEKDGFDVVYLIVSPQSPFKDASNNLSAQDRVEAARMTVSKYSGLKVLVDDIELRMPPPQYTIRTLDALREREPENEFTLVVGADNLESFPCWRDYARILTEYGLAVFPRKGYHRGWLKARLLKENPSYRIELLKAPVIDISSTEIRQGLKSAEKWKA